ncbi:MAG: RNA polymerase sigma factor [Bacteroidia bacterium]|nr:RNA polymerase sigma factor [Bacteroidia bacterium]
MVQGCLAGDRQAQRQLYEQYKRQMFGYCLRYAGSREEAEDLLHEGFLKIFRDLHQYHGKGALGAWMRQVMVHTAIDHLRRQQRQIATSDLEAAPEPGAEDPLIRQFESHTQELIAILQRMPPGYRTILNLYVLEGYSHKEIAAQLNIQVSTSKTQLMRAREVLRKHVEKSLKT